jgi:hypothetical protein
MHVTTFSEENWEMADRLHGIILKNKETQNEYCRAINLVTSKELKSYFQSKCDKLKRFDGSLVHEVSVAFPQILPIVRSKNYTGTWMSTDSINNSADEASMLKVSIQCDKAAVGEYADLLERYLLPFDIYHLIRKHKMFIEVDLYKFKKMEDLY